MGLRSHAQRVCISYVHIINTLQVMVTDDNSDDSDFVPEQKEQSAKRKKEKKERIKTAPVNPSAISPPSKPAPAPVNPSTISPLSEPVSLRDAFLVVPDQDGEVSVKPVAGNTTTTRAVRTKFLTQKFSTYEDLDRSRKLMGLNISQSNRSRTRIRYRDKSGPKKGHLVTFRYNKSSGAYQRATQVCGAHITLTLTLTLTTDSPLTHSHQHQARPLEKILKDWDTTTPHEEQQPEAYSGRRRSDVIWTHEAATLVLNMVDVTKVSRKYTLTQIAEMLNLPRMAEVYKHPHDRNRKFTRGNVQAFLKKMFPSAEDTQAGINVLGRSHP